MEFLAPRSPSTQKILGRVRVSSKNEIRRKVAQANAAKVAWKELGLKNRLKLMRRLYFEINKRRNRLASLATREMGMPIKESISDVKGSLRYFKWYLDNAEKILAPEVVDKSDGATHKVVYEPLGTTAVIVAWNFPFGNFVARVIQNLIVGNVVVFKHAEECPLSGKEIEDIIKKSGLPKGVFSEVYGDGKVGDYLVRQNVDFICFTGSTAVGKHLYQVAAGKFIRAHLECGGSAPGIVFNDADIDSVLDTIYLNRFLNCGQMCDALKRLLVQKEVFNKAVLKLKQRLESVKVGNPEGRSTEIGPLVSERQLRLLLSQVNDAVAKGAKVVCGGRQPPGLSGPYYEPTILTNVTRSMRVWKEEVFGPVLPVMEFGTEKEAVELGNDTVYGLGAYVFTKDKKKALRVASKLASGMVGVNNALYFRPTNPFGGYKNSGIGREHGKYGFYDLCQVKVISA